MASPEARPCRSSASDCHHWRRGCRVALPRWPRKIRTVQHDRRSSSNWGLGCGSAAGKSGRSYRWTTMKPCARERMQFGSVTLSCLVQVPIAVGLPWVRERVRLRDRRGSPTTKTRLLGTPIFLPSPEEPRLCHPWRMDMPSYPVRQSAGAGTYV